VVDGLHSAVQKLSRENHPDATQEDAPFERAATQCQAGSKYKGSEKEVNEETGMTPYAEL
jgi:hypothetical protein